MKRQICLAVFAIAIAGVTPSGVGSAQPTVGTSPRLSGTNADELLMLQQRRENYEKQLKAMSTEQLVHEMTSDSQKGREPFNSAAYREAVSRGQSISDGLRSQLIHSDRTSLLALLALRQISPEQYRSLAVSVRLGVLTDALKNSTYFNTWGIPTLYWEDAAKAIIAEDGAAEPFLAGLLRDTRPAPVFGSEAMNVIGRYHFRVCDYALALVDEIRHQNVELPADPAGRDRLIEQMLNRKKPPARP